jgi:predicted DsbA family dithiol-disulfide isomerase
LKLAGSNLKFEVAWKPFELNPDMPKEGMNRRAYRSRKFGSWEHS